MTTPAQDEIKTFLDVQTTNALEQFEALDEKYLSQCQKLVIFLDYDGTLSPIVANPNDAILAQSTREILQNLQKLFLTGIITGRSLSKIQEFVQLPELYYAGSHGFDIKGPNGTKIKNEVAVEYRNALKSIHDGLKEKCQHIKGVEVEDNKYSISLHHRNADPSKYEEIEGYVNEELEKYPTVKCNNGKMVFEFKPKMDWHKGKALVWLLQALELDERDDVFTIYIGDDTTDEDAFAAFHQSDKRKGLGIVVTEESKLSGASFTLHNCTEVHSFLQRLVEYGRKRGE